jgi:hypothetical protein
MKLRDYLEHRFERDDKFRLETAKTLAEQNADLTYLKQSVVTMKGQLEPVCRHVELVRGIGKLAIKGITFVSTGIAIYKLFL